MILTNNVINSMKMAFYPSTIFFIVMICMRKILLGLIISNIIYVIIFCASMKFQHKIQQKLEYIKLLDMCKEVKGRYN